MNKTPVSILQEMMVKKGTVPSYELIHDGGGSHMNTFTFQVTCDGLRATGTGRCKKDAKHEAAKAMLEVIAAHRAYPQLPASPAESPVRTPLPPKMPVSQRLPPDVPFVNAIGALQDLCSENNLQEPQYVPISDVGPPHAKVFTCHCIVSTFKEEGVATTKKQAKQEAAKKMLLKFKDIIGDVNISDDDLTSEARDSEKKRITAGEVAKVRYPQLSKIATTRKVNLGLKLSEYHKKLKTTFDEPVRKEIMSKLNDLSTKKCEISDESVEAMLTELKEILTLLKLELESIELNTLDHYEDDNKDVLYMNLMKVYFTPEICEVATGCTKVEAKMNALKKVINTLLVFLE